MKKRKKTEFYLLRKRSLSEGDLFITDYIRTKQRLEKLEERLIQLNDLVNEKGNNSRGWYKKLIL